MNGSLLGHFSALPPSEHRSSRAPAFLTRVPPVGLGSRTIFRTCRSARSCPACRPPTPDTRRWPVPKAGVVEVQVLHRAVDQAREPLPDQPGAAYRQSGQGPQVAQLGGLVAVDRCALGITLTAGGEFDSHRSTCRFVAEASPRQPPLGAGFVSIALLRGAGWLPAPRVRRRPTWRLLHSAKPREYDKAALSSTERSLRSTIISNTPQCVTCNLRSAYGNLEQDSEKPTTNAISSPAPVLWN